MTCFLGIFRLIFQEEILLEQEDAPIGCEEHQSLVTGNLPDINFTISLGFPKNLSQVGRDSISTNKVVNYSFFLLCSPYSHKRFFHSGFDFPFEMPFFVSEMLESFIQSITTLRVKT